MTLRAKLLIAQLPLALALLMVGVVSYRTVNALDHNSQDILKDNFASVLTAERMSEAADVLERAVLARTSGDTTAAVNVPAAIAKFSAQLAFQQGNITEPDEAEVTAALARDWAQLQAVLDTGTVAEVERSLIAINGETGAIMTLNQDAMLRKSDRARRSAEFMAGAMLAVTLAALVLGLLPSSYLTTRLVRPLGVLARAVRRVGEGDLAARAVVPGKDEVAEVAAEFNTMAARLAEYRSSSLGDLLQAQQASQAAIDSLPDPVVVMRLDGGLLNANIAATTLFGLDAEAPDDLTRVPAEVKTLLAKMREHIVAGRPTYVPKNLEEAVPVTLREGLHYFLTRASAVQGAENQLVGYTVLFADVTRLRRFDELKTDLVATVAHEFRTPLTSLRMAIHLCIEDPAAAQGGELLYTARDDCQRLQEIVDDILDLSRIQAGKIELHVRPMSSAHLIADAVQAQRELAQGRRIELRVAAGASDRAVVADPERVRLVLANFVTNALRYCRPGDRVEVGATSEADGVRFDVRDTGPGIAAADVARVFERFFRAPDNEQPGAGLGLYICKEIIDAHAGRIGVESAVGQGARFWFVLPSARDS